MPELKKIDIVESDLKKVLELIQEIERKQKINLKVQEERDMWKQKYEELKKLYQKTWF